MKKLLSISVVLAITAALLCSCEYTDEDKKAVRSALESATQAAVDSAIEETKKTPRETQVDSLRKELDTLNVTDENRVEVLKWLSDLFDAYEKENKKTIKKDPLYDAYKSEYESAEMSSSTLDILERFTKNFNKVDEKIDDITMDDVLSKGITGYVKDKGDKALNPSRKATSNSVNSLLNGLLEKLRSEEAEPFWDKISKSK